MASYAQKVLSRPHAALLPVFINHDEPKTAVDTTINNTAINLIRCLVAALLIMVIVLLSCPGIIYYIVKLQIPTAQLDWLSISNLNVSDTHISGQWEANITATNPDKRYPVVILEAVQIAVYYKGFNSSSLSEFSTKNVTLDQTTTIHAKENISKVVSVDKSLPYKEMAYAKKSTGKMSFEVEMKVVAIQLPFSFWDKRIGMRFLCPDIPIEFNSGEDGKALFSHGMACTLLQTDNETRTSWTTNNP